MTLKLRSICHFFLLLAFITTASNAAISQQLATYPNCDPGNIAKTFLGGARDERLFPAAPNLSICKNTTWYFQNSNSDTVFVFVHGLGTDNLKTWRNVDEPKSYWPELIRADTQYGSPSILLAGYPTDRISNERYDIRGAANTLRDTLNTALPGDKGSILSSRKTIIFVAHSMGGVVVRHMLTRPWNSNLFKDKKIGLALIASPTFGSEAADVAEVVLKKIFGLPMSKQAEQLRWESSFLLELFEDMQYMRQEKTLPYLVGMELVESGAFPIVTKASAGRFFPASVIPGSDHFTIAAPKESQEDSANTKLRAFYLTAVQSLKGPDVVAPAQKRVILMDSYAKIYASRPVQGEMNSHVIRRMLGGIDVNTLIEPVHVNWNEQERIAAMQADLIVVHHSAFGVGRQRYSGALKNLLTTVLRRSSNTKIIVYGRGKDWSDFPSYVRGLVEQPYRDRLIGYHVLKHGDRVENFENKTVSKELRRLVLEQLELPP